MSKNTENTTYEAAFNELQELINEIENGEISVDQLSEKVKRASVLIKFCKDKLRATELDVEKILEDLKREE
ncbi:MAG: exodeoxyribonuclease VII small subunit [Fluviicola sp.]|jgi:exodeoxyribonuclease VII small subunit